MQRGNLKSNRTDQTSDVEDDDESRKNIKQRTAIVQKYYDIVEPKVINSIVQKCIMALVWGFGSSLTATARPKYSLFLHELI